MDWEIEFLINLKVSKCELEMITRALHAYSASSPLSIEFAELFTEVSKI